MWRRAFLEVGPVIRKDVNPDFIWEGTAMSDRRVPEAVMFQGRKIRISSSPVGIDWDYIQERAAAEETRENAVAIRKELGDCKLILSVGPHRLHQGRRPATREL